MAISESENDPGLLWAEIHRLRSELEGPQGFDTWQDAAVQERQKRVHAENLLRTNNLLVDNSLEPEPYGYIVQNTFYTSKAVADRTAWATSPTAGDSLAVTPVYLKSQGLEIARRVVFRLKGCLPIPFEAIPTKSVVPAKALMVYGVEDVAAGLRRPHKVHTPTRTELNEFYNRHWTYWSGEDQLLFKSFQKVVDALPGMYRALQWYRDEARAIQKNMDNKAAGQALLASMTVLSLDNGGRAEEVLYYLEREFNVHA